MHGIYVHLPFCPYVCPYCDFAKWPLRPSAASAYLDALVREITQTPGVNAQTIFFGGGTPNAYAATTIASLVTTLRARFPHPQGRAHEISVEVNPELVEAGDFDVYAAAGVTRISIGVQSFVDDEIAVLGRKHTSEQVEQVVKMARAAGIASVSIDLIFAVPGQTRATWGQSLARAIELNVDHISTYGLTVEEGTPFWEWHRREPARFLDQDREAELYAEAIERLGGAGFEQYEISNFARSGHECAHNRNYWENGEYLGFGVGAASYREGERSVHTRSLADYIEAVSSGRPIPGDSERLSGIRKAGEAIMLALRTTSGVNLTGFRERYGVDVTSRYRSVIEEFVDAGLLECEGDRMRLSIKGRFVANDVCEAFIACE